MYYKREARGKNVIPNVEFWMGFPLLIKVCTVDSTITRVLIFFSRTASVLL